MFQLRGIRKLNSSFLLVLAGVLLAGLAGCSSEQAKLEEKIQVLLKAGDYERALKVADEAIEKNPDKPYTRAVKTRVLAEMGQTKGAIAEYKRFVGVGGQQSRDLLWTIAMGLLKDREMGSLKNNANTLFYMYAVLLDTDALAEMGDKRTIPALQAALQGPLKIGAACALARLGEKAGVPILRDSLKDLSGYDREWSDPYAVVFGMASVLAAEALAALKEPEGLEALQKILKDSQKIPKDVKKLDEKSEFSIANLANFQSQETTAALRSLLEASNAFVRLNAAKGLAKLKDKEGVTRLKAALKDPDLGNRFDAALALAEYAGDNEGVSVLQEALKEKDSKKSIDAARGLAILGYKDEGMPILLSGLKGTNELRLISIRSLGEVGDKQAIPSVFGQLEDEGLFTSQVLVALWKLTK